MSGVNRHFLGWSQPILHSAADLLVERGRSAGEKEIGGTIDLSRCLVTLPGGRAGRRLVELLLSRSEALRAPLIPPRIVTVGELPEELYRSVLPFPPPLVESLAWTAALGDAERDGVGVDQLLPPSGDAAREGRRDALGTTLRALHREVGAAGLDFSEVALRCAQSALFNDEGRWRVLGEVENRYRAILARSGFLDRTDARRAALAGGSIGSELEVWVIGAPDLTPLVRSFLRRGSETGKVEILVAAPEGLADHFDDLGCVLPAVWCAETAGVPAGAVRFVSGPAAQADAIVERLRTLDGRVPAEAISIGVPDAGIIPWIEERLEEVGVPVRYGGGIAVETTPTWRLLSGVAEYLRARDFDSFAALVRHPHLEGKLRRGPGAPGGEGIPTLLDRYQREHLQSRIDAGSLPRGQSSRDRSHSEAVQEARDILRELLAPLDGVRPLAEWRPVLAEFLLEIYGSPPLQREVERERILLEISRQIAFALADLESIPVGLGGTMSGERMIRLLLRELKGATIPPASEEGAIELLGWLELPLDDAEVLVITGVNEPHLPDSVSADPFLPHALRQELGLLDNEGRLARDLFHLRTILGLRPDLLLIAGRRDAEGTPLLLSRLVLSEGVDEVAARVLDFLGENDRGEGEAADGGEVEDEGEEAPLRTSTARFLLPPDPVLEGFAPPERIRVTDFGRFLQDPYRFALERNLGLGDEDDRMRELDGMGFGSLAHTVLERFGTAAGPVMAPREIRMALFDILDQEVRSRFGSRPLPALRLQVEQLRLRLGEFADRQAEWMQEGWRIEGVELDASGEEAILPVDGSPVRLAGKVDRIDFHEASGEWRLLDYKTGERGDGPEKVHRRGRGEDRVWVDLQLPLYRHLAPALRRRDGSRVLPEGGARIEVGYILLPREPGEIRLELAAWSEDEWTGAIETAREVVREMRVGRFLFDPASSAIHRDDPLAPVVGGGVLAVEESDGDGSNGGSDG